jgi:hypothetical protein
VEELGLGAGMSGEKPDTSNKLLNNEMPWGAAEGERHKTNTLAQ